MKTTRVVGVIIAFIIVVILVMVIIGYGAVSAQLQARRIVTDDTDLLGRMREDGVGRMPSYILGRA